MDRPDKPGFAPGKSIQASVMRLSNGIIRIDINNSVLNETKQYKQWPNIEDFGLVNYSFNTGNICSKIGQIVTEFYLIFQHLNE